MRTPAPISATQVLDTGWMADAACRRMPDLPWTTDRDRAPVVLWDLMAAVCEVCPVRARCSEFVAEAEITGGYWAGKNRTTPNTTNRAPNHAPGRAAARAAEEETRWVPVENGWEQGLLPLDDLVPEPLADLLDEPLDGAA